MVGGLELLTVGDHAHGTPWHQIVVEFDTQVVAEVQESTHDLIIPIHVRVLEDDVELRGRRIREQPRDSWHPL